MKLISPEVRQLLTGKRTGFILVISFMVAGATVLGISNATAGGTSDDFNDNNVNTAFWGANYGRTSEVNGKARVGVQHLGYGGSAFRSTQYFDFTSSGDNVTLQVASHPELKPVPAPRRTTDTSQTTGKQYHILYTIPSDGTDRGLDTRGQLQAIVGSYQRWL